MAQVTVPARSAITPPVAPTISRFFMSVYTKDNWNAGSWTLVDYMEPIELNEKSIHGDSFCTFNYVFGDIKREDQTTFSQTTPPDVRGKFVCIRVTEDKQLGPFTPTPYVLWVGYIPRESLEIDGIKSDPLLTPLASGTQTVTARGLEYLLDKRRIEYAPVVTSQPPGGDSVFQLVNVVPTFNVRRKSGRALTGNRSDVPIVDSTDALRPGTFGFSNDASVWTYFDVLNFALVWSDNYPNTGVPHFKLGGDTALLSFLQNIKPEGLVADDRSVLSLIRMLLDQRRGIDATLRFSLDSNLEFPEGDIELYVYSTSDVDVSSSGRTLPANRNQVDVTLGTQKSQSVTVKLDSVPRYSEIVVQGEPMQVVFTAAGIDSLNPKNDTDHSDSWARFDAAWTGQQQIDFLAASFAGRQVDPKHERVFRRFKLVANDGTAFDWRAGSNSATRDSFHPQVLPDGANTSGRGASTWGRATSAYGNIGMKMLRELPLLRKADAISESVADVHFDKPVAIVRQLTAFTDEAASVPTDNEIWFPAHKPPAPPDTYVAGEDVPIRPDVSARVTVSDRELEIDVHFVQGAQVLAANDMLEADVKGGVTPAFDWREMLITIAIETDFRPSIVVQIDNAEPQSKFILRVKDAHYWIAGNAVVSGVSELGKLLFYTKPWADRSPVLPPGFPTEGFLRNDMERLNDVAAMAQVWYGRERASMTLEGLGIYDALPLGTWVKSLIQDLNRTPVGSVVTGRTFSFQKQSTTITSGLFGVDPRL